MSIKAQELRIGNWVHSKLHCLDTEVFTVFHKSVKLGLNPLALYNEDEIEGIPITEEWLLRFGFSNENLLDEYYLEPYYFNIIDMTLDIGGVYVDLEYIHQLQNLIHALTGKEL